MEYDKVKYYVAGAGYFMDSKGKYLHHKILPPKKGFVIDHVNGNKLDNSIDNLRYVTKRQNAQNSKASNSLGVKGVYLDKNRTLRKPYRVMLRVDGKQMHYGRFATLAEAKKVANEKILEHHKEYARLNK